MGLPGGLTTDPWVLPAPFLAAHPDLEFRGSLELMAPNTPAYKGKPETWRDSDPPGQSRGPSLSLGFLPSSPVSAEGPAEQACERGGEVLSRLPAACGGSSDGTKGTRPAPWKCLWKRLLVGVVTFRVLKCDYPGLSGGPQVQGPFTGQKRREKRRPWEGGSRNWRQWPYCPIL